MLRRECFSCGSTETYVNPRTNWEQWNHLDGQLVCHRCYCRRYLNPKWNHITYKEYQSMRVNIMGKKRIQLDNNPRIGYCSICPNNIFDGSCKRTNIHHINYHENDPLKDTIELCNSYHGKVSMCAMSISY